MTTTRSTTSRTVSAGHTRPMRRAWVCAAALAGLAGLAGCGDDEGTAAAPADPPPAADTEAPAPPESEGGSASAQPAPPESEDGGATTQPAPTAEASAGPDDPAPTTTEAASEEVVELRDGTVAGIELPAHPDELREALSAVWGEPDLDQERAGCPLGDPDTLLYEMAWDDLTVYGQYLPDEDQEISVWKVTGNDLPENLDTPFDIIPGTPFDLARDVIPAVEEGNDLGGNPELRSPEREGMAWIGDEDGTEVSSVSFNEIACD